MKNKEKLVMGLIAILVLTAALFLLYSGSQTKVPEVATLKAQKITPIEAKQRMDQERGIILLDVRTAAEYQERHISGSVLVPLDQLEQQATVRLPDKQATLFVYCQSGRRSAIAVDTLIRLGYINVYDLGGIVDWPYQ